jgi:hypothetical protein
MTSVIMLLLMLVVVLDAQTLPQSNIQLIGRYLAIDVNFLNMCVPVYTERKSTVIVRHLSRFLKLSQECSPVFESAETLNCYSYMSILYENK